MAEFVSLFHHMVQLSVPVSPHFADPAWVCGKGGIMMEPARCGTFAKRCQGVHAVNDVTFRMGEIYEILDPNGAGKTIHHLVISTF